MLTFRIFNKKRANGSRIFTVFNECKKYKTEKQNFHSFAASVVVVSCENLNTLAGRMNSQMS